MDLACARAQRMPDWLMTEARRLESRVRRHWATVRAEVLTAPAGSKHVVSCLARTSVGASSALDARCAPSYTQRAGAEEDPRSPAANSQPDRATVRSDTSEASACR